MEYISGSVQAAEWLSKYFSMHSERSCVLCIRREDLKASGTAVTKPVGTANYNH